MWALMDPHILGACIYSPLISSRFQWRGDLMCLCKIDVALPIRNGWGLDSIKYLPDNMRNYAKSATRYASSLVRIASPYCSFFFSVTPYT
jgi:hypothetical protein